MCKVTKSQHSFLKLLLSEGREGETRRPGKMILFKITLQIVLSSNSPTNFPFIYYSTIISNSLLSSTGLQSVSVVYFTFT